MAFKIQHWPLTFLAISGFIFFMALGWWQVNRAQQKMHLLKQYQLRMQQKPLTAQNLPTTQNIRFFRAKLSGRFDNKHTFLLDNTLWHGQVGYEVYTLFYAHGLTQPLLVDRGFIPLGTSRQHRPILKNISGPQNIQGLLNTPPRYQAWGPLLDPTVSDWPLRIEFVNLGELSKLLKMPLFPYILNLDAEAAAAYQANWQIVTVSPERHKGYALQWFALAFTVLLLFVVLNGNNKFGKKIQLK